MGNAQQPATGSGSGARFATASRAFSAQEIDGLRSLFRSLAAQSQSGGDRVSKSVFLGYYGILGPLGDRLFEMVADGDDGGGITFEHLAVAKARYEKGTQDEIDEYIYKLCDVTGDSIVDRSDLQAVLDSLYKIVFTRSNEIPASFYEAFLSAATFTKEVDGLNEKCMSLEDFRKWCNLVPSLKKFLGSLLTAPDSVRPGFQVPKLQYPENLSSNVLILKEEYAWHIGGAISQQYSAEWKLLYHSALHGLSFNTFLGNVSSGDGPTVFLVKDAEGFIYGGYASQAWERHSDFYGDMRSFLFQLYPRASIFRPSGGNNSLQWCAVNFSSESIPNGIGFGGRPNHFGLFISANFDRGHTFTCTTFNSPCLSRTNTIQPETIECWGLLVGGLKDERPESLKGTVLERFKEDRNMLKLVGLASSSD